MSVPIRVFALAPFVALIGLSAEGDVRAGEPEWRAVAELDDGSRLVGTPDFDAITVESPEGPKRFPLKQVSSAGLENGRWVGYRLDPGPRSFEGIAAQKSFRMKTLVGTVDVPAKHIRLFELHANPSVGTAFPARSDVVLHFDFDEPSPKRFRNRASYRHHAAGEGVKWIEEGHLGGAVEFDKTSVLEIPHHRDLCPDQFTLAAWIRPDDHSGWRLVASKTDAASWHGGYGFCRFPDDDDHLYFYAGSYSASAVKERIPQQQWTHVAGTFDGENVRMFVNGEPSDPVSLSKSGNPFRHTTTPFLVGGGNSYNWAGQLDELVLYRRALSIEQVEQLMVATSPTKDER